MGNTWGWGVGCLVFGSGGGGGGEEGPLSLSHNHKSCQRTIWFDSLQSQARFPRCMNTKGGDGGGVQWHSRFYLGVKGGVNAS